MCDIIGRREGGGKQEVRCGEGKRWHRPRLVGEKAACQRKRRRTSSRKEADPWSVMPLHSHSHMLTGSRGNTKRLHLQAGRQVFARITLCLIRPCLVIGAGFGQVGGVFPASRHPKPNGSDRQSRSGPVCLQLPCRVGKVTKIKLSKLRVHI